MKTFAAWKDAFVQLQSSCDILMLVNNAGIKGWDDAKARAWVLEHTRITTCTTSDWMMPYCVLGYAKDPVEQGAWAAEAALAIAGGAAPSSIPIASNERARVSVNATLSSTLGVRFPLSLVKTATVVRSDAMTAAVDD